MKISIYNFKVIGSLANYEMRPLTILSGTNSSGKSSFIQLLLLLKQSLETINADNALNTEGKLFNAHKYIDIIKDKNSSNKLKIEFLFNKSELTKYEDYAELSIYNAFDNYNLHVEIEFDTKDKQIIVSSFSCEIVTEINSNFVKYKNQTNSYSIETNVAVFSEKLYGAKDYTILKINYSSFFPSDYEIEFKDGTKYKESPKLDGIKTILKDFFENLNYVGPLRQSPKDEYSVYGRIDTVGYEGENTAEVLYSLRESKVTFDKIEEKEDDVSFVKCEDTFLNVVKYWICERFKMCSDIYSKKDADTYAIYVKSLSGIESTIKHVGFGISQVLPIIVEGLRIEANETLVLEQPEIHLHPKVQSNLTDFFISLVKQGKKVILETHSDHLITRLRRRIAEDPGNQLDDDTLLTFIEVGTKDILFRNIEISDLGNLDYFPDDFIEKSDTELKAILKAQMKKRINQLEK